MSETSEERKSGEAWLTFDLPVQFDEHGVIDISMVELDQQIAQRAMLFSMRPSTAFVFTHHTMQRARLVLSLPNLRVTVRIPLDRQLDLFHSKQKRARRNPDLFGYDEDAHIQSVVVACVTDIKDITQEIGQISDGIEQAEPNELQDRLKHLAEQPSRALRSFVVNGGSMEVNVDGHSISIEAPGVRSQTLDLDSVVLRLRLHTPSKGSGISAKILEIVEGSRTHLDVGNVIRLGFLDRKPAVRALLLIALEFELTVCLEARFAVSVESKSLLTAEVIEVKNASEILEAFQRKLQAG